MFSYYLGIVIVALLAGGSVALWISHIRETIEIKKELAATKQRILSGMKNRDPEKMPTKEGNKILGRIWIPKDKHFIA
ncbi:MAG: hypothetical protein HGA67_02050 [Candidatus Yonathbacteria bacterium]|nr:hypothetical protein [Candidatus Yonathbacteria bacterium]